MKKITTIAFLLVAMVQLQAQTMSQKVAATVMATWKDSFAMGADRPAKWTYDQGVILKGFEGIWKQTGDPLYYNYIKKSMDFFVDSSGNIKTYKASDYNIDNVNNGRELLLLYRVTGLAKYWKAATQLREQLQSQPRTSDGGFWHKKVYPNQMWLDGLYMGEPFYAEYAYIAHDDTAYNDIAKQFILMEQHARDKKTGLLYHGWDESKQQKWANKETGNSPNFWARSIGWYVMALVDVLDYFPENNPHRKELVAIVNRLATAVQKVQDPATGLWYQIPDKPSYKGNYLEASASAMFVYALAKGVRKGYLPATFTAVAQKGYDGITKKFIEKDANGQVDLNGTVSVGGLGGTPYRDGSVEYYLSEKVIKNDPKGIGAFLLAANEIQMIPTLSVGKGATVLLDNYFNHETKKDFTGKTIAWHYVWDEMDNNGYSMLGNVFEEYGAETATLTSAPTADNLKKASVFIIVDPDTDRESANPNYVQPNDVAAISEWVKGGGVLALFSNDSINAEFPHFNTLAEKFGIHYNQDLKNPVLNNKFEMGAVMVPPGNMIFKTASKVHIKELSSLKLTSPATTVLQKGNDVIVAVAKYGKGMVFAVGDPWFYNEYLDGRKIPMEYENYKAATDFVQWVLNNRKK